MGNPFYCIWQKQRATTSPTTATSATLNDNVKKSSSAIDWDSYWDEYTAKYQYAPKNAVHLWNFAKEEKFDSVKYKTARKAFDRMVKERTLSTWEGRTRSNTDLGVKHLDKMKVENEESECLKLRVSKHTSSEDLIQIKSKYMECLEAFRRSILYDPRSSLQLFNFINESMPYKVRYGDVKKCHNFAVKHKWFQPMKRTKNKRAKRQKQRVLILRKAKKQRNLFWKLITRQLRKTKTRKRRKK